MEKRKFKQAEVEEIKHITLYAIRDNNNRRRKTPVGIFVSFDRAAEYIEKVIEKHEENKESYDYDIDEMVVDMEIVAAVKGM